MKEHFSMGWKLQLAIKVDNLQVEGAFKSFDAECEALRNIRHQNLVKIISSCSNNDFKALVLVYVAEGEVRRSGCIMSTTVWIFHRYWTSW
jgi:hypothetical protein